MSNRIDTEHNTSAVDSDHAVSACIGGGRWNVEWSCSTANWRDSNVEEMLVGDDEVSMIH